MIQFRLLYLLFIFYSNYLFSCECINGGLIESYANAETVGEITIVKLVEDLPKKTPFDHRYKVEVNFDNIYKGKPKKYITAEGSIRGAFFTDCSVELKVGERYLVFFTKYGDNEVFSLCTNHIQIDKESEWKKHFYSEYTKLLPLLKKNKNIVLSAHFSPVGDWRKPSIFDTFQNFKPKNSVALYKLILDDNLEIVNVKKISAFKSKGETDFIEALKKNLVINFKDKKAKPNEIVLVVKHEFRNGKDAFYFNF